MPDRHALPSFWVLFLVQPSGAGRRRPTALDAPKPGVSQRLRPRPRGPATGLVRLSKTTSCGSIPSGNW